VTAKKSLVHPERPSSQEQGSFNQCSSQRRIAYEIDPAPDRHEVDDGPVLRRERLDVSSAVLVRFSEREASVVSVVPLSFMAFGGATGSNSFSKRLIIPIPPSTTD
jgi:hypothetical protein